MKKSCGILLAAAILISACQTPGPRPASTPTPGAEHTPPAVFETAWDDLSIYKSGLNAAQQAGLEQVRGAPVYHLDYRIDESLAKLEAQATIWYTNREQVPLSEVQFRLFPNILGGALTVESLKRDGAEATPSYGLENSLLSVPFDPPLEAGASARFEFQYQVSIPQKLESNYGVLASSEGVLTLAHAYPHIPVYDDEGWNAEIPSEQGDLTYAEAGFYLVRVQAPDGLVLAASGSEVSREENDGEQTVVFAAGPARDFFLSASERYEVQSEQAGSVTVRSYAPASLKEGSRLALETAVQAVQLFSQRYGDYPYSELDVVATPTYALGIEYPGAFAISLDLYDLDNSQYGEAAEIYLESTVAHEVGHQWFYNLVGNDQADEPWLDESLTQFITWQYFADRYGQAGASGFEGSLHNRWARVENEPIPIGQPVSAYEGAAYGAIVYGRGAFFFDALSGEMGREAFDVFMKDYTQKYAWKTASTEGFKGLAEEACGCDLRPLFKEWVYSQP